MKSMHVGAIICFILAIAFYLLAWLPGAYGLGLFGLAIELVAWIRVALRSGSDPDS